MENQQMEDSVLQPKRKLGEVTEEDRHKAREKKAKEEEYALKNLRQEFLDKEYLKSLSTERRFTLARWYKGPYDTKYIKRALQACGKDALWHKDVFGFFIKD